MEALNKKDRGITKKIFTAMDKFLEDAGVKDDANAPAIKGKVVHFNDVMTLEMKDVLNMDEIKDAGEYHIVISTGPEHGNQIIFSTVLEVTKGMDIEDAIEKLFPDKAEIKRQQEAAAMQAAAQAGGFDIDEQQMPAQQEHATQQEPATETCDAESTEPQQEAPQQEPATENTAPTVTETDA